jgi:hypothetical protein
VDYANVFASLEKALRWACLNKARWIASALLRRAAHRDCLPRTRPPKNRILSPGVFVPLRLAKPLACFLPMNLTKYLSICD